MCEPVSLGLLIGGAVLSAGGAGLQAYGSVAAGKAANAEAQYQGRIAQNNAVVAAAHARDARERGAIEETRYAQDVADLKGQQRASLAANGVMLGTGSAARVLEDTAMMGSLDAATIRSNTERESLGFLNERNRFLDQANLYRAQGAAAKRAGVLGAVTGLVSAAGQIGMGFAGGLGGNAAKGVKAPQSSGKYQTVRLYAGSPQGVI